MNLIIFERNEITDASLAVMNREKARGFIELHQPQPGDEFRVGEIDGKVGLGRVLAIGDDGVRFALELTETLPQPPEINLILALPRPQMLKRIFQTVATLGVTRLALISTKRVQKSYFQSLVINPENTKKHLILGLEQGVATSLPLVTVHSDWRKFIAEGLTEFVGAKTRLLLAHPRSGMGLAEHFIARGESTEQLSAAPVTIVIGPEGGLTDAEVKQFEDCGFETFCLGARILRVETAVTVVVSSISLLRNIGAHLVNGNAASNSAASSNLNRGLI